MERAPFWVRRFYLIGDAECCLFTCLLPLQCSIQNNRDFGTDEIRSLPEVSGMSGARSLKALSISISIYRSQAINNNQKKKTFD